MDSNAPARGRFGAFNRSKPIADVHVAIVTGAGSGIGRAVCTVLSDHGFHLTVVGRTESRLTETIGLLGLREGTDAISVVADVGQPTQARVIIDQTLQKWGRIDALINNAAVVSVRPIQQTDEQLLSRLFTTNTFGPAYLIAQAWPVFVSQRHGCIVNVSSMATLDPFPGLSAYAASKSALESLTRSIQIEGRAHGIRAFTVAPGAVETEMLRQVVSKEDLSPQRAHDPMDVARVIGECVSGRRDVEMGKTICLPNQ